MKQQPFKLSLISHIHTTKPSSSLASYRRTFFTSSTKRTSGYREPLDTSTWKPRLNPRWTPMTLVLVSVPILTFALGTWQVQRLNWKKELIHDLENKMALEPISLPKQINPRVIPEFEYRKVKLTGKFDHSKEIFIESRTRESELGYHLITPFYPDNGGQPILVNRGFIKRELKNPRSRPLSLETGDIEVIGMLRKQESKSFFQPNNSKDLNQWYFIDIQEISEHLGTAPILVDAITYANSGKLKEMVASGLPIGRSPQIVLRNMHATYIATWYGLSAVTTVMAVMLLRKPMSGKSRYSGVSG
ncbi:hypothetical protein Pst134EA_013345 [Puccinia striiformis f. sp. tritici]|uniref:hypothetical protein n=1 Tax=Puccinia striiformis f. sp. tritici TaxID=168172 RepID=UPI0020075901|nr:hypothetical protein Pst134EA_013345 [Puccinia striiformis f. sp. tritici]KAH9454229.1 hypothetical protein Pst134EB_014322 [Puccinia striiformis f. sp. tritici]KAH9465462.1 hypothetical protein Pst134EA_013345 [Puccinia striiformis f. sp. tritici]